MKNRVAIYTRLSKEDLDKRETVSESIRNQESMLLSYAEEQGWEVYDVYRDEDYSGAYAGDENLRPQFNRMIADAEKHKFNIILCKSQSRFSRNMEVVEQYIHGRFAEWGIRFISLIDNADTDIKGNKKSRQINSLVNEWYVEELSDNIRAVFRNKMTEGECLMAFAPYGYMKDPNRKNHLIINPKTAPTVKRIFDWHAEGYGAERISRMLNDEGIPCPRKQQELDGKRKKLIYAPDDMGRWSATSVGDILRNQVYCGDIVQHTVEKVSYKSRKRRNLDREEWIIKKDMHEPIVSREMFEAAQKRLGTNRTAAGTGKVHILAGKVFCHCCGKPMQKNSSKGSYEYLRCRDKYAYSSKDRCLTPNIRIDTILAAMGAELSGNGNMGREIVDSLIDRIEFGDINEENSIPILKIYWAWE